MPLADHDNVDARRGERPPGRRMPARSPAPLLPPVKVATRPSPRPLAVPGMVTGSRATQSRAVNCAGTAPAIRPPMSEPRATAASPALPADAAARHFEDYVPGLVLECGPIDIDETAIVAFGRQFDPQWFHTDPAAAAQSPFGGVIASGWHTASLMMRLLVDNFLPRSAGLGSPGVDELRWVRPVRPGDRLTLRVTVTDAQRSRSKPDRGLVRADNEMRNQDGATVLTVKTMVLMRARDLPAAPGS